MATWRERVLNFFGGVPAQRVSEAASTAYAAGYNDGNDEPPSGELRSYGYTRATGGGRQPALDYQQALSAAWTLWSTNPVAKRILEIKRDYIIGGGVQPQANDPKLQAVLDELWDREKMDNFQRELALQLYLFGAQVLPVFIRESDGRLALGYLDPAEIETVITHPDNARALWAVVIKASTSTDAWQSSASAKRVYYIARAIEGVWTACPPALAEWETAMLGHYGLTEYTGGCIYHRVNAVSNQALGCSDLLTLADWLHQLDDTLFALADREQMAGYFTWDVTMNGAKDGDLKVRAGEISRNPPRKGSVNVHNENEIWKIEYPDLKQTGTIETERALLAFILGGFGIPVHWYGSGDETNRATAQAQGDPTWRSLKQAQGQVQDLLLSICYVARDAAVQAGTFAGPLTDETITMTMPEMTAKDLTSLAASVSQLATAIMTAQAQNWISGETARAVFVKLVAELGMDIDATAEGKALEQEAATPIENIKSWFAQHGALS